MDGIIDKAIDWDHVNRWDEHFKKLERDFLMVHPLCFECEKEGKYKKSKFYDYDKALCAMHYLFPEEKVQNV